MLYSKNSYRPYDRVAAVTYSNQWALYRNPQFLDYSNLGGDCTNFVSQCIYAGSQVMNYDIIMGWYYLDGNRKAPAWTGVPFLYQFLTRMDGSPGPYGIEVPIWEIEVGDIIQLSFNNEGRFGHSLFVVESGKIPTFNNILVNTHSQDRLSYPLSGFSWNSIRFIKILGVWI
ncbi:MAG TPA: amidase domain-containing protein [Clostridia bacterium]|nr:amidase domain-containing protein [Clostridia bacterium]